MWYKIMEKQLEWKEVNVNFAGCIDAESLPITCVCGYGDYWEFIISIYKDDPYKCPKCGREYYFKNDITVFVSEGN